MAVVIILNSTPLVNPENKNTLDWFRTAVGPPEITGTTPLVREIVPLNPPMLETITKTRAVEPLGIVRNVGFVARVKSGGGDDDIVSNNVAVCIIDPLFAVKTIE